MLLVLPDLPLAPLSAAAQLDRAGAMGTTTSLSERSLLRANGVEELG